MAGAVPSRFSRVSALSRRARWGLFAAIVAIHGAMIVALIGAFGPISGGFDDRNHPLALTTITLRDRAPRPQKIATPGHAAARASIVARARINTDFTVAAVPPITIAPAEVQVDAGAGSAASAGQGRGLGDGGTGSGSVATRPAKIAGDLTETDYPNAGRAKRLGTAVIVALTVAADGHVSACRVHQPSGDPDADAVTCTLALARFRFRPALDRNGRPVESTYGWQQSFFWNRAASSGKAGP